MTTKDLRLLNYMTQREFAKKLEVSQSAVNKWEQQNCRISKKTIEKMDEIFYLKRLTNEAYSFDIGAKFIGK